MAVRTHKAKAKVIKLDPRIWLRNAEEIRIYRELKLKAQKGRCAVGGHKVVNPVVDHCHEDGCKYNEDGRVRGVLESDLNMLEGRFLKLFKRAKIEEKYGIDFPTFLINLGSYLKLDNSQEKFHYAYMADKRKEVNRCIKNVLIHMLEEDFGICADKKTPKAELVQMYMQNWVKKVEESY